MTWILVALWSCLGVLLVVLLTEFWDWWSNH